MSNQEENDDAPGPGEHHGGEGLDDFIRDLTDSQSDLKAFILAALGNYDDASEVLQRTNLVLWKKVGSFRAGAEFMPWAIGVAKYQILSFYRDQSRDKHVFSEEVVGLMIQTAAGELTDISERHQALRGCIEQLPPKSREILRLRYDRGSSIRQISTQLRRTENAVKSSLLRVRKSLERCIDVRLKSDMT